MVHTQRYRYLSPHLNAEKTHFQSIEMKHNTLLYDAILPPPLYILFLYNLNCFFRIGIHNNGI